MSFALENFEQALPFGIAGKGLDYYENGAVARLARDGNTYFATVYGTEEYEVEIALRGGQVESWHCGCPYDHGPICKHVAAVLFEVREREQTTSAMAETAEDQASNPIDAILAQLNEEELRRLLQFFAQRFDKARLHLLTQYAHLIEGAEHRHFQDLIGSIIEAHTGGGGFIGYREAGQMSKEISRLLEDTRLNPPAGDRMQLAYACGEAIRQLARAIEDGDDPGGSLGGAIEHAFSILLDLCEKNDEMPAEVIAYFHKLGLEECDKELYEGRHWGGGWRHLAAGATRSKTQAGSVIEKLGPVIAQKNDKGYLKKYDAEQAAKLQLQLLEAWYPAEEAEAFLRQNLSFSSFRRKALEQAIAEKRYEEARQLAEDGMVLDTKNRLPGLVKEWEGWLRKAAEAAGD